jgi:hypothetical protein
MFVDHCVTSEARFKAVAFKKVVAALVNFPQKISTSNLKDVNAVQGVGKGSMAVVCPSMSYPRNILVF